MYKFEIGKMNPCRLLIKETTINSDFSKYTDKIDKVDQKGKSREYVENENSRETGTSEHDNFDI